MKSESTSFHNMQHQHDQDENEQRTQANKGLFSSWSIRSRIMGTIASVLIVLAITAAVAIWTLANQSNTSADLPPLTGHRGSQISGG
jgi:hypothetical protein